MSSLGGLSSTGFSHCVEGIHEMLREGSNVADIAGVTSQLDSERIGLKELTTNARGSLYSALMLATPSNLINMSLGSFVIGIAVYLGFLWTRNLDTSAGTDDSRNVFIIFLICVVFCISSYSIPHALKDREVICVRLYRRLLFSFERLKQDVKEKSDQQQSQHLGHDPVFRPIAMGNELTNPVQAIGDIPRSSEDITAIDSTNHPPLHARYAADNILSTLRHEDGSSQQAAEETQETLGANDAASIIADSPANTSLIYILQAAAQAHEASAAADRKVAEEYRRLVDRMGGPDTKNPA